MSAITTTSGREATDRRKAIPPVGASGTRRVAQAFRSVMTMFGRKKLDLPSALEALPGRDAGMPVPAQHHVLGSPLQGPFPEGIEVAIFGMGCFWGAERKFWEADGVHTTAVGYSAGLTPNPTYEEVCTGLTGHNEVVLVAYDTAQTSYDEMLRIFWENHDPTQGMRQGNDVGTQYRSGIYVLNDEQRAAAKESLARFQERLSAAGYGPITTEIIDAGPFYYAEDYHQQYLAKNPWGYCGLGGTGVSCPVGVIGAD
jgi:peptide-methionine (S)-S-oxide reductase